MTKRIPEFLYKYRECSDRAIENLQDNLVWCGTLDNYNDPYEGYTTLHFLPIYKAFLNIETLEHYKNVLSQLNSVEEITKFASSELGFSSEEIESQITEQQIYQDEYNKSFREKHRQSTAICSFAEEYDNRLMWSHYTDNHTGICIGYETKQMKKFLYKVKYKNEIFDISNDIIKIMTHKGDSKFNPRIIKPNQMVIQKDDVWKYEKEWRLINPRSRDTIDDFEFDNKTVENKGYTYKLTPSKLYLGTRILEENKFKLISIAKAQNLTVNQMIMDETSYKLIPNKIIG